MPFKTIFKYYWLQIRKHKWAFFGVFVLYGLAYGMSTIVPPLLYRKIIDLMANTGVSAPVDSIWEVFFLFVGVALLCQIFFRAADFVMSYFQTYVLRDLANFSFSGLTHRSNQFFSNMFAGSLVAKSRRFVSAFETMHDISVFGFWPSFLQITGVFVVLFVTEPLLGELFLLWFVVFIGMTVFLVRRKVPYDLLEAAEDSKVTGQLSDVLANILNIKLFSSETREKKYFEVATEKQNQARSRAWNFTNIVILAQGLLMTLLELGGMYITIKLWLSGKISVGTVALVQTYFAVIFGSVWNLGKNLSRFAKALSDASEMVEIFEQPVEVVDPVQPEECKISRGKIVFQNISFGYNPTNPVLKNFTLTIHPGERVGLVGSSGAGKTTITKLLLRFADPQSGAITIDGVNIAHITQDDLRRSIAYVPQDPVLFHRSLKENIAYGKGDAGDEAIISAAKKAHAHEFISGFPEGYETLVGERGVKLSGGERQRVAIARAILKNAPILVLDEATSSLDTLSEKYIQEGLEELMRGKTVIVVAHRLSTVRKMDRIVVLGERGIEEEGTHDALVSLNGKYASFWKHQTPARNNRDEGEELLV